MSKYTNGPGLVYTLMLIHHEIMSKMGCYKDDKTDYMRNGWSAYVGGRYGQSVVLFFLGLSGYNRVEGNKSSPNDWGGFVFAEDPASDNEDEKRDLCLMLVVSDDYYEAFNNLMASDSAWINSEDRHTVSKYLSDSEIEHVVREVISSGDRSGREKDSKKPGSCFENNEESWVGKNIILYKDKNLNFLSELVKDTKISFSEIGYPDQYEVVVPIDFNFPHEVYSKPIKWMFREDLYEIFANNTDLCAADIYCWVEKFRRNRIDTRLHERINAAGIMDEVLELLLNIGYFPSRGGVSNEYFTAWRIEQFRKKYPASYYHVLLKMVIEDKL